MGKIFTKKKEDSFPMVTKVIHLPTVEKAKEFSSAMGEFKFPVDLSSGRYTVNGKSLMGIFSLDLNQPLTLTAEVPPEEEPRFLQVVAPFAE